MKWPQRSLVLLLMGLQLAAWTSVSSSSALTSQASEPLASALHGFPGDFHVLTVPFGVDGRLDEGGNCMIEETLSFKRLDDVAVGDWVWATTSDGITSSSSPQRVVARDRRWSSAKTLHLTLTDSAHQDNSSTIMLTLAPEQQLLSHTQARWTAARDARPGDVLQATALGQATVMRLQALDEEPASWHEVHRLQVDWPAHSFFIRAPNTASTTALLVHNVIIGEAGADPFAQRLADAAADIQGITGGVIALSLTANQEGNWRLDVFATSGVGTGKLQGPGSVAVIGRLLGELSSFGINPAFQPGGALNAGHWHRARGGLSGAASNAGDAEMIALDFMAAQHQYGGQSPMMGCSNSPCSQSSHPARGDNNCATQMAARPVQFHYANGQERANRRHVETVMEDLIGGVEAANP